MAPAIWRPSPTTPCSILVLEAPRGAPRETPSDGGGESGDAGAFVVNEVTKSKGRQPRRGNRITDDELRDIAEKYREAQAQPRTDRNFGERTA
jgi:hypothetical protein